MALAVRLPSWSESPALRLNGRPAAFERRNGYATLTRRWRAGDRIELKLPMQVKMEPIRDDPRMVAFTYGPLVLAAELAGPTPAWEGPRPGLLSADPATALQAVDARRHELYAPSAVPAPLTFKPFFNLYDRRTAVYLPLYTAAEWATEWASYQKEQREKQAIDSRTIDLLQPGESDQERAHDLASNFSEFWQYGGRGMRDAWWGPGHFVEASMAVRPGASALRVLYWGEDVNKDFAILVDGRELVREKRKTEATKRFVAVEYPLPERFALAKRTIRVRFESRGTDAPFYELRTVTA
jgi:hypothetical protein